MASTAGRGAQVRLSGDAQRAARGTNGGRLADNIAAKMALDLAASGYAGATGDFYGGFDSEFGGRGVASGGGEPLPGHAAIDASGAVCGDKAAGATGGLCTD